MVQHLRKNVPVKTAQIKKHGIEYVKGSKLIDCLMTIKETLTDDREVDFPTREEAAKYCKRWERGWVVVRDCCSVGCWTKGVWSEQRKSRWG